MTQHLLSCLLVSFLILSLSTCRWWLTPTQESDLVTGLCPSSPAPLADYTSCASKFLPCWLLNPSLDISLFPCFFQYWLPACRASSYSLRGLTSPSRPYLTWTEQSDLVHCYLSSTKAGALPRAWSCLEPVSAYQGCHYLWSVLMQFGFEENKYGALWFVGQTTFVICLAVWTISESPGPLPRVQLAGHAEKAT